MNRGDIYLARLDPIEGSGQAGERPVVIVSRTSLNEAVRRVVAVPLTTYRGRPLYPGQVRIPAIVPGLTRESIVLCEQIRALVKSRLLRRLGALPPALMAEVDQALAHVLDLGYQ